MITTIYEQVVHERAELAIEKKKLALRHDAQLALAKELKRRDAESAARESIVWTGTLCEFADWINLGRKQKWIKAADQAEALAITCPHFVQKDGAPISPDSVNEMLRRRVKRKAHAKENKPRI